MAEHATCINKFSAGPWFSLPNSLNSHGKPKGTRTLSLTRPAPAGRVFLFLKLAISCYSALISKTRRRTQADFGSPARPAECKLGQKQFNGLTGVKFNFLMNLKYAPVLPPRNDIQANSGVSATKTWKQAAKVKPETAIPDALQVQVQKR